MDAWMNVSTGGSIMAPFAISTIGLTARCRCCPPPCCQATQRPALAQQQPRSQLQRPRGQRQRQLCARPRQRTRTTPSPEPLHCPTHQPRQHHHHHPHQWQQREQQRRGEMGMVAMVMHRGPAGPAMASPNYLSRSIIGRPPQPAPQATPQTAPHVWSRTLAPAPPLLRAVCTAPTAAEWQVPGEAAPTAMGWPGPGAAARRAGEWPGSGWLGGGPWGAAVAVVALGLVREGLAGEERQMPRHTPECHP
mmetsp:Transcript_20484/g.49866  ORF Transcript_20484/g.49866 Transcript_20484/m.49866 type:complete len:249 (+) Transcript_20484:354-1100(+)